MEKDCCDIKVTEIENGYRLEITGDEVKERCSSIMDKCGKETASLKKFFKNCCCSSDN